MTGIMLLKRRFQNCWDQLSWNILLLLLVVLCLDNNRWWYRQGSVVSSFVIIRDNTPKTTTPLPPSSVLVPEFRSNNNNNYYGDNINTQCLPKTKSRFRIGYNIISSKATTTTRTTTKLFTSSSKSSSSSSSSSLTSSSSYVSKELQLDLSSGVSMQVLLCQPKQQQQQPVVLNKNKKNNVLLFLHGSFHGAWCWMEYWGPYFAERGYTVVASSWRGTAGTYAGDGIKKVKIREHLNDLQSLLQQLPNIINSDNTKPIVITHSFGGIVLMKYLEELYITNTDNTNILRDTFAGIVSICSVPPSGNGKMTLRFIQRSLIDSYKITVGFAMKKCLTNINLCRDLFFGGPIVRDPITDVIINDYGISDEQIQIYQKRFEQDSKATIDLFDLAKQLPIVNTNKNGVAPFASILPPTTVMGATEDFIVDTIGNQETATYYNINKPIYIDSPHDIMLGSRWENGATILYDWIQNNIE